MSANKNTLKEKLNVAQFMARAESLGIVGPTGIGSTQAFGGVTPYYSRLSGRSAITATTATTAKTAENVPSNVANSAPADSIKLSSLSEPEYLTSRSISQLLAKDISTKEKTIYYLIKFCRARMSIQEFMLELYEKGSDEEIRDYFKRNINGILILPMDIIRKENTKLHREIIEIYKTMLGMLEKDQVDKAYIKLYPIYLNAREGFASIKSSAANYAIRQKISEYLYYQEIIRTLKPFTTYAEKFFRHTESHALKNTSQIMIATDITAYYNETVKKFEAYDAIMSELFGAHTPFSAKYINEQIKRSADSISAELERCRKFLKEKSGTVLGAHANVGEDFYSSLYKLECDYLALVERNKFLHAELKKLNSKIQIFNKETRALFEGFPEKINILLMEFFKSKFENIQNGLEKQLTCKELVIKEAQDFREEYAKLFNEKLGNVLLNFNGENLGEISEAVAEFPNHTADLLVREKLFLEHIADMLNKFKEKLANRDKKIADDAVKIEEENAKLKAESEARYQAQLQAHQAKTAKIKKEKDDLKAQLKEKRRQELLLQQQNQAREEKEQAEKARSLTKKIVETKLNDEQEILFDQIFSDKPPHYKLTFTEIKKLILDLGGKVISDGGSHQKMQMHIICLDDDLCVIEDEGETENVATHSNAASVAGAATATTTMNPNVKHSRTLVKPHEVGHNSGLLSQYAIKQVRALLERVGLRWQPRVLQKATFAN